MMPARQKLIFSMHFLKEIHARNCAICLSDVNLKKASPNENHPAMRSADDTTPARNPVCAGDRVQLIYLGKDG